MHEILKSLQAGSRVLDLGCAEGSFPPNGTLADVVRLDREAPKDRANSTRFVQANAATLPFPDQTFTAVISNHSLNPNDWLLTPLGLAAGHRETCVSVERTRRPGAGKTEWHT